MADIPVNVWQVVRDDEGQDIILLRDEPGRILPIVIGTCEAAAIWVRLAPELAAPYVRRPWAHDLMQALLEQNKVSLERIVIDDLSNGTFFATLHLLHHGQELVVDARPSDAIALLMRIHSPLFVNAEVMESAAFYPGATEDGGEPGNEPDLPDGFP